MTHQETVSYEHPTTIWLKTYLARIQYEETTAKRVSYVFETLGIFLIGLVTALILGRIPQNCYDLCDVDRVVVRDQQP